jgi:glutamate-1-semialdehyde 2,1-aminomutase
VHAGSGVATLGLPDSPGVPARVAELTLSVPVQRRGRRPRSLPAATRTDRLRHRRADRRQLRVHPAAAGVPAQLRELTTEHGALLIFDEVMTGFRVALGGAQERFGVTPGPDHAGQGDRRWSAGRARTAAGAS